MRRLLRGWSPSQTALRGVWSGADLAISQDILVPETGYYPFSAYVGRTPSKTSSNAASTSRVERPRRKLLITSDSRA